MAMESNNISQSILRAGKALAAFAIVSSALVAITFSLTKDKIIENEKEALLKSLNQLIPQNDYDNNLHSDNILIDAPTLNHRNKKITVYRARKNNQPVAAIFSVIAPDGYNGAIKLLIAINYDETLAGVRVIKHKETPGLGDAIDIQKSSWISQFDNKSLVQPVSKNWRVKKDGGSFDQLTGATITPRAIVKITKKTLSYFGTHKSNVFKTGLENG